MPWRQSRIHYQNPDQQQCFTQAVRHTDGKISDPTARGRTLPTVPGELLFAPRRFTLHARHTQNVKFYYKGPADDHERYYRITFTESPAAQVDEGSQTQHRGTVEVKLALQSILVVRPRQSRFAYQLDPVQSAITNTGNTYFEFMVKQGCQQADSEADSKYLLPGETYHNPGSISRATRSSSSTSPASSPWARIAGQTR